MPPSAPFLAKHAREVHPVTRAHHREGARPSPPPTPSPGSTAWKRCGAPPSRCGAASMRWPSPPRPRARRCARSRPIRSAPIPGSAPTPTSSTCSTWLPSPCPAHAQGRPSRRRHADRRRAGRTRRWRAWAACSMPRRRDDRRHRAPAAAAAASAPAAPAGTLELAVVGAHLSGMALNHELRSAGGLFLRAVDTEASYELYALPGGPPERPGLVRVAAGTGHAIATEVWALPARGLRRASSPASRRRSASARCCSPTAPAPKGFLCEARPSTPPSTSPPTAAGAATSRRRAKDGSSTDRAWRGLRCSAVRSQAA